MLSGKIVEKWENGFGNLKAKIADYLAKKEKLKALRIEYGTNDSYPLIPSGCAYFAGLLKENSIAFRLTTFDGGHSILEPTIEKSVPPFFYENLIFSGNKP